MDLDAPYRVNPREPFEVLVHRSERGEGCLLGTPDVVRFVRALAMHATVRDALDAAELAATTRARVVAALEHLAATGVIVAAP
ncbi:mycofactocin biosynthesis chaperone MftB [Amycolatopsis sp. cg9]|uniref:mycofactocin biosynthesis chaperone MftB n=1 Tax=Amycolatopsis sp. cg9 TaxID=3238801 RepID=UPI003523513E